MNKKKIFIAVDTNSISIAKKIIRNTQTNKIKIAAYLSIVLLKEGLITFVLFTSQLSTADNPYELLRNMLFLFGSKIKFLSTFLNNPMF